jgi:hypothetical protein
MRKPAKKLHSGIICQNGNRTGMKRLNGDRDATQRTIEVQVKCHIAKVICMLFNWGSRKILDSESAGIRKYAQIRVHSVLQDDVPFVQEHQHNRACDVQENTCSINDIGAQPLLRRVIFFELRFIPQQPRLAHLDILLLFIEGGHAYYGGCGVWPEVGGEVD